MAAGNSPVLDLASGFGRAGRRFIEAASCSLDAVGPVPLSVPGQVAVLELDVGPADECIASIKNIAVLIQPEQPERSERASYLSCSACDNQVTASV